MTFDEVLAQVQELLQRKVVSPIVAETAVRVG